MIRYDIIKDIRICVSAQLCYSLGKKKVWRESGGCHLVEHKIVTCYSRYSLWPNPPNLLVVVESSVINLALDESHYGNLR